MKRLLLGLILSLGFVACQTDEPVLREGEHQQLESLLRQVAPNGSTSFFELPESDDFDAIPQDRKSPITRAKVELGKLLFHEPAIGMVAQKGETMQTYSCASCHHVAAGFQSGMLPLSLSGLMQPLLMFIGPNLLTIAYVWRRWSQASRGG